MKRQLTSLLALLLLASLAAAGITIEGETKVDQYRLVRLSVKGAPVGAAVIYDLDEDKLDIEQQDGRLLFTGPPGTYRVKATAITLSKEGKTTVEVARVTVTIAGKVPPGPGPDPKPPDPKPPEPDPTPSDDAPIKAPGFRVLIVFESADLTRLPAKQLAVLYSKPLRDYLGENCAKDSDNQQGAYRIWDKDVDATRESKPWQDALKRKRTATPWIVISTGRTGYEGPLPASVDETTALLQKYKAMGVK